MLLQRTHGIFMRIYISIVFFLYENKMTFYLLCLQSFWIHHTSGRHSISLLCLESLQHIQRWISQYRGMSMWRLQKVQKVSFVVNILCWQTPALLVWLFVKRRHKIIAISVTVHVAIDKTLRDSHRCMNVYMMNTVTYPVLCSANFCIVLFSHLLAAGATSKHGTHWMAERVVSAALYGILPAAYFMEPSFAMDTALTSTLVVHCHWWVFLMKMLGKRKLL